MWGVLPVYMSVTSCASGAHGGQDGALDPMELELQVVVSHHVGAVFLPVSPARAAAAVNC